MPLIGQNVMTAEEVENFDRPLYKLQHSPLAFFRWDENFAGGGEAYAFEGGVTLGRAFFSPMRVAHAYRH